MTKDADKPLRELDAKQYKQVGSIIFKLLRDPEPRDSQALKGVKHGERRVEIGEYRIVYTASQDTFSVLVIGKRNDDDVYKIWQRLMQ